MLEIMPRQHFDQIFSILENSFPLDEYRTYIEQKNLLNHSNYTIYTLSQLQRPPYQAFAAIWRFPDFSFLEHFAVNPEFRNQGLGASFLQQLKNLLNNLICLEVELPKTDLAARRIEFYKRNGFFLNDYPYIQPPISKGRNSVPLILMTSCHPITADRFQQIKKILYREVYQTEPDLTDMNACTKELDF